MSPTPVVLGTALSLVMSAMPCLSLAADRAQEHDGPLATNDGPTVYIELDRPDPNRGAVKLARYRSSTATAAADAVIYTTLYDELCTEPCGVSVDTSERPLFFFVRDGQPISYSFRLNQFEGAVTLKVRPIKRGLLMAGVSLAVLIVGIPMWIAGVSKVWAAPGEPDSGGSFTKLKKAKL